MKKLLLMLFATSIIASQLYFTEVIAQGSGESQQQGGTLGSLLQTIQSIYNVINSAGGQSSETPATAKEQSGEQTGLVDTITTEVQKLLSTMTSKEKAEADVFGTVRSILNASNEKISESQVLGLLNSLNANAQNAPSGVRLQGIIAQIYNALQEPYKNLVQQGFKKFGQNSKQANLAFIQTLIYTIWLHNAKIEDETAFKKLEPVVSPILP